MQLPSVDIFWGEHAERLVPGGPGPVVPEGLVGIRVFASRRLPVTFDDEPLAVVWSSGDDTAYAQVDLTNRVGFHRVAVRVGVRIVHFDFQTSTAKATWADIKEMARHITHHVFAFRRQFHYALPDGTRRSVSLPEIEFGWLRERVPEVSALVDDIARRPGTRARSRIATSLQGRCLAVAQTLSHLRENPQLMEAAEGGPLVVNGVAYWPSSVRVRRRQLEPARHEHEQIAFFLRSLATACIRLRTQTPKDVTGEIGRFERLLAAARGHAVIRKHDAARVRTPWSPVPTILQRRDERYRRLRALHAEYMMNIAPHDTGDDAVRANVRDVWEIYQAFCAHVVGQALDLQYTSRRRDLRDRDSAGRSMAGETIDLYYDARPPSGFLPSWRDLTARPAAERPDIVLVERDTGRAVVLDVKFRTDRRQQEAHASDLQEMQGYMQSYGLVAGGIVFPGRGETRVLSGFGCTLVELPLRPASDHATLLERVREAITMLWTTPVLQ